MNDSLLRRFCESPHRKLIVVIATTVLGVVVLIPLADEYFDKKESYASSAVELDRAFQTAETLPMFEQRVADLESQLHLLEERSVSEASISRYRSRLVDLVRKTGCQMRRLDVSTPTTRAWYREDDPLRPRVPTETKETTPFLLERRSVHLAVDGPIVSLYEFLDELLTDKTFAYPNRIQMHNGGRAGDQVSLELELWVFALREKS